MIVTELALPLPIDELRRFLKDGGAQKAFVFGSYARGEQTDASDLDLLVTFTPDIGLFEIIGLQQQLEKRIGRKVDLVTRLNRHFAPYIEPDLFDLGL